MNWKLLADRRTVNSISRLLSPCPLSSCRDFSTVGASIRVPICSGSSKDCAFIERNDRIPIFCFHRYVHFTREMRLSASSLGVRFDSDDCKEEEDGTMNEFLSRFVWIMRGKLSEAYPDCDKKTIDGMLLVIVEKVVSEMEKGGIGKMLGVAMAAGPSQDLSEDLWRTVWEVSNSVLEDMEKERKKEKMKQFLQCKEVNEMCRFAGEAGVRGDMLREMRFKWAREKMEESEFKESLERLREAEKQRQQRQKAEGTNSVATGEEAVMGEEKDKGFSLPKRHGNIKYKIYGLDLSHPRWAEVAHKIHESEELSWPQEPKPISGKCEQITEKILSLKDEDDPSPLLAEWIELLEPTRVEWVALLDQLKGKSTALYYKVAEHLLSERSFETNQLDYTRLIDGHAKEKCIVDAERILKKMTDNGMVPDILTANVLVRMYSEVGSVDRAKEAFESLRSFGFRPDMKVYNSMIMAYVKSNQPKLGESLMREMEARDIKPTEEIYMALLQSYAQQGDVGGAGRIATTMQFAGIQPSLDTCTLLIEAYGQAGDPDQARSNFDYIMRIGLKPDDRCTASMIAAYENKNLLDKALNLLLELEKDGFEPGPATYAVLVDWLGKLQLVDEAEQLLGKIAEQGESPPFKIQVSLCDMYARAGIEKKALQALGVLESKKEQLSSTDFVRIVNGLVAGGFSKDAKRIVDLMDTLGFTTDHVKVTLSAAQIFSHRRPTSSSQKP